MGDRMRPVPFEELMDRIFSEYRNHGTIFGISKENFHKPSTKHSIEVLDKNVLLHLALRQVHIHSLRRTLLVHIWLVEDLWNLRRFR